VDVGPEQFDHPVVELVAFDPAGAMEEVIEGGRCTDSGIRRSIAVGWGSG